MSVPPPGSRPSTIACSAGRSSVAPNVASIVTASSNVDDREAIGVLEVVDQRVEADLDLVEPAVLAIEPE